MRPARQSVAAALLVLGSGTYLQAQTAPAADATKDAAASDDIVILSPFVVSGEADKGSYTAKDTLAGSRLRTELKDVGSAVSVVTAQLMIDLGVKNSEELLKYTTNTEVGGISGNFAGVPDSQNPSENSLLVKPNANTRVRGLTAADNTRDFFLTDIPWDGYNVGRVDMQRGPNAILFGMGSPAGIINTSINEAAFLDANKIESRIDNESSYRWVVDLNKVLLKDELAVRVTGLSDHTYYRQKPAYNYDKRIYGALRYDPSFLKKSGMVTSFKANYERGDIKSNYPRSLTPYDQITPWFDEMGKATYDANQLWATDGSGAINANLRNGQPNPAYSPYAKQGVYASVFGNPLSVFAYGATSANRLVDIEANQQEQYWAIGSNGQRDGKIEALIFARMTGVPGYSELMKAVDPALYNLGVYKDKGLTDRGVFDFYNNLLDGDNKKEWRGFEAANFRLSQTFLENRLGLEAVYDKQRYHDGQLYGVDQRIFLDNNTMYLDGTANPYVGSAMVQTNTGGAENYTKSEAKRLTGFGEFRSTDFFSRGLLTKLLGRHTVTGMYAEETKDTAHRDFLRYAMTNDWATAVSGPAGQPEHFALSNGYRQITSIAYLSNNLSGLTSASDAHLGRVTVDLTPRYDGYMYRLDSTWLPSTNPSDPTYVDPAAPWTPPPGANGGTTQSENPNNYMMWNATAVPKYWSYEDGDAAQLYTNGNKSYRKVKTQAFIWQGYMLDDCLVGTVGWRKDKYVGATRNFDANSDGQVLNLDPAYRDTDYGATSAESLSYSIVAHTPRFLKAKMPWQTNISFFYNRSSNIQPRPTDSDMSGAQMANPSGKTKDFGFVLNTLDDRLSLKVNWYRTSVETDRLQGFNFGAAERAVTMLLNRAAWTHFKDPNQDGNWSADKANEYSSYPTTQAKLDHGAQLVYDAFTNDPLLAAWLANWGSQSPIKFDNALQTPINQWLWWSPSNVAASTDTVSKGVEFEISAKPTPSWNVAINFSKTQATQQNIGGALKQWVETLDTLFKSDAGDLRDWWAGGNPLSITWNQLVMSQFTLLKLKEGSNVAQLRPWRFNLVNNYGFSTGFLKGVNVGGAYRWESGSEIGYPVLQSASDGSYTWDIAHPYKGPSEDHYDVWIGYERKLTERINWRIQLNIKDLFSSKKLIPVSVNPDGSPAVCQIPALTSWQLTNTFSF